MSEILLSRNRQLKKLSLCDERCFIEFHHQFQTKLKEDNHYEGCMATHNLSIPEEEKKSSLRVYLFLEE